MNEILIDAFRHKLWALQTLIAACQERSVDELTRPAPGFGSILATLNHLVLADAGYVASLGAGRADWASDDNETNDLQELVARALQRKETPLPSRLLLIDALSRTPLKELPLAWRGALGACLKDRDDQVVRQTIATARASIVWSRR